MKGADLVAALADKNSTVELGAEFGTAAYTAFASVNWATVAFVATDKAAKLTAADCAKIARFVQLADVFSIPVVTVVNTEGFEASSAAELAGSVRDAAKLAQVTLQLPRPRSTSSPARQSARPTLHSTALTFPTHGRRLLSLR